MLSHTEVSIYRVLSIEFFIFTLAELVTQKTSKLNIPINNLYFILNSTIILTKFLNYSNHIKKNIYIKLSLNFLYEPKSSSRTEV